MLAAHKEQPHVTVYLVTNQVDGKTYVGVTRFAPKHRWTQHVQMARLGKVTYFYNAIRKYGADKFTLTELASCLNVADASEVEQEIIKRLAPDYNQTNGGEITIGKRMPEASIERIRAANTGKRRTAEVKQRQSEARKQFFIDNPEKKLAAIARIKAARLLVDETKRIAASNATLKGRPMPRGEARDRWIAANKTRRTTPEQRAKIAEKHKKPVECVTLGVTFDSVSEAAHHLHIGISTVSKACLGKLKSAGGLKFRFA